MRPSSIDQGPTKDHRASGCDKFECKACHIDEETYQTQHVDNCSGCKYITASQEELCAILKKGRIPIVQVRSIDQDETIVPLLEAELGDPYIAFSHVWSDGLGNPSTSAIPQCQFKRLSDFCLRVGEQNFWLDTLCVPLQPKDSRKAAIRLMRRTYENASKVVVLDKWLMQHEAASSSNLELLMRVTLCGWARRLWTFQEGTLNKWFSVVFSDDIVDLDAIAKRLQLGEDDPSVLPVLRTLTAKYDEIPTLRLDKVQNTRERLDLVAKCLQFRSTRQLGRYLWHRCGFSLECLGNGEDESVLGTGGGHSA